MLHCPFYANCAFYNDTMPAMPSTAEVLKQQYCCTNPQSCALYQVIRSRGPQALPQDMTPDQSERMRLILAP